MEVGGVREWRDDGEGVRMGDGEGMEHGSERDWRNGGEGVRMGDGEGRMVLV